MSNTGSAVATITSGANTPNPTIVLNSVGSFSIRADVSSSANYTVANTISDPIDVSNDMPIVEILPIYNSSYTYQYNTPYEFENALAIITNNTGQTLTYSIVTADSTITSFTTLGIATINTGGTSFVTNTIGSFKIRAYTPKTSNGDFGSGSALSDTIEITKANPTILQYPQIILPTGVTASSLVYGQQYTINPLTITVTGIATQYIMLGTGAYNYNNLWYSSYCNNVPNSTCHAGYRLRFSNGIVSNLTLTSDSPYGLTNPDLLFALSNVPFEGVSAILQGLNISTGSDNLWYDIDVPEQFITQSVSTVKFSGNTGNFNSTPSSFQTSVSKITSNTDTNPYPNINYTSSDATIATISGTTITIVGVGHFQIMTTVSYTTNYTQILRSASPQIYDTIQAIPTITSFPTTALLAQTWVYGQQYLGIIPPTTSILTSNNDTNPPHISYSTNNTSIATISGNTITITGVGNFQILVTIHATINFVSQTYTYPTINTYYTSITATPIITFPKNFTTSSRYGSAYVFVPPVLSNNDPSQSLTYSIFPSNSAVATINYSQNSLSPSFVINSVGTFQIQASCLASINGYYSAAPNTPSPIITIANEMPIIAFNTSNFESQYTCHPSTPILFSASAPIASITNNNVQKLTYSIVATDGVTPSTLATIFSDGTSLTTISVGSFQILATVTATANGDYGSASLASETITIISATPVVNSFPTLPTPFIYGNVYTIPSTITTSNTDTYGPIISYSSNNSAIATISGLKITIVGVGNFQILVTIGATANYNSATYVYPTPSAYYTSIQATPTISPFSSNFGSGWVLNGTYNLVSSVTTNADSGYTDQGVVTYSIINPSVSNNASLTSSSQIMINDIGTFQIQANLAATTNFTAASSVRSNTITITTSSVSLKSNNFQNFVYGGGPYTLSATTTNTDTNPPPTITYGIATQSGSTGNGTINGNILTITAAGGAYIYVTTTATENFYAASLAIYVNIAQATQVIGINTPWFNAISLQVGSAFSGGAAIQSNNNTDSPGPTYTLSSNNTNIATVAGDTLTCIAPGIFTYQVNVSATANFSAVTFSTPAIYVCVVPEIIIFNNPQVWPAQASTAGEVGLIIGFPTQIYPNGFTNYSQVVITNGNNGASIQIDNNTTPYSFDYMGSYGKYLVFFEPGTAGALSGVLSTSTAGNIGYVAINNVAGGMAFGQPLNFTFTGKASGLGPDTLSVNWNPGSIDLSQGLVYGSYYSIAPWTAPFYFNPSGMTISNGYYIVGWSGYNWGGTAFQAWGVQTTNTAYSSNSPLMMNGSFYAPEPSPSTTGGSFYMGIPKILFNSGF